MRTFMETSHPLQEHLSRTPVSPLHGRRILVWGPWTDCSALTMALSAAGAEVITMARLRRTHEAGRIDAIVMDAALTDSWGRPWSADVRASQGTHATTPIIGIYSAKVPPQMLQSFDALVLADRAALELAAVLARSLQTRAA
jgi:hypothetical protein